VPSNVAMVVRVLVAESTSNTVPRLWAPPTYVDPNIFPCPSITRAFGPTLPGNTAIVWYEPGEGLNLTMESGVPTLIGPPPFRAA